MGFSAEMAELVGARSRWEKDSVCSTDEEWRQMLKEAPKKETKDTRLYGQRPYLYRRTPSKTMSNEIFVKNYVLCTADSFETGGAYSLHLTEKDAKKFKPANCWSLSWKGIEKGYVSKITLEKIISQKKRRKTIFRSWER